MLLRFTLSAAGALVLASTATAQLQTAKASPITTTVKDAGVYHMATGTWTRGVSASALAGPEVIYDNTCTVGYYTGLSDGDKLLDSGRIPSTSSPTNATSLTGLYDLYEVNGFSFAYCTFEPLSTSIDLSFIDCYTACDGGGVFPTPTITFNIVNAPGGTAAGGQGCWILTFDLTNTSGVFNLGGDCNGTYNNTGSTDSFGWAWTQSIPTTGSDAGPIFGGDPNGLFPQTGQVCGGIGGGTTFVGAGASPGTGIGITDQMELVDGPTAPGCYWFGGYGGAGGNPFSAFYLQLEGKEGVAPTSGTPYCFGDGTGTACPCGNTGGAGAGCANSSGGGATMVGSGSALFSNDTLQFAISGVAGSKPGLLLRGNNQVNGGLGNAVGDGLICSGGGSQRSQVQLTDAGGNATFTNWNGSGMGSVANVGMPTNFQYWYRDPMGSPCGAGFNFSNAWTVTYMP